MAEKHLQESRKFPIPGLPLEVTLALHRNQPPELLVSVTGPKFNEHKDPRHAKIIRQLFDALKTDISGSGFFPTQGRLINDPYANDSVALRIHYPSPPPSYYSASLIDTFIRNPIDQRQRKNKNKKNSERLFGSLSEKMPTFISDLATKAKNERFSYESDTRPRQQLQKLIDQETQDAYDVLGVTPDASWDKIKRAYRSHARKAHPDVKNGVDDGSFQKLQQAYELIKAHKSGK